jgi:hypothetical protein
MIVILKRASMLLVVATVIPSVAHALELPGKLRLTRLPRLYRSRSRSPPWTPVEWHTGILADCGCAICGDAQSRALLGLDLPGKQTLASR